MEVCVLFMNWLKMCENLGILWIVWCLLTCWLLTAPKTALQRKAHRAKTCHAIPVIRLWVLFFCLDFLIRVSEGRWDNLHTFSQHLCPFSSFCAVAALRILPCPCVWRIHRAGGACSTLLPHPQVHPLAIMKSTAGTAAKWLLCK